MTAFVAAMLLSSALMVFGGHQGEPGLTASRDDGWITIHYSFPSSTHGYPATVAAWPVAQFRPDDVAVLMGGGTSDTDSAPANVQGLVDHLVAELRNIRAPAKVSVLEKGSLGEYLESGNGTLVIASSVDASLSGAIEDWVTAGGLLVAIGPEALSSFAPSLSLTALSPFDPNITNGSAAQGLGLRTNYPQYGISVEDVLSSSGTVLGTTSLDGRLTTMAVVPMGLGRALVMGGPIESPFLASMEDVYAWDLARCLTSGLPWISGPITYQRVEVPSGGLSGTMTIADPGTSLVVSAYNLNDWHAIYNVLGLP